MPIPQVTIKYKTYVKEALVEALGVVFEDHPDEILQRKTSVDVDYPLDQADFPRIIVRFFERSINNAGIGHTEMLESTREDGKYDEYKHYLYNGDIEFAVYALSSYDRDLVSDALVQVIAMGDLSVYAAQFLERIYEPDPVTEPTSLEHYINLNTDTIQGFGETQVIAPWMPEDTLVYQTSYRIGISGEFYSLAPEARGPFGFVEHVDVYPWVPAFGETEPDPDPDDGAPWIGD